MQDILDRFEQHSQLLADSLTHNLTYQQRYAQRNIEQEIQQQQTEINTIIDSLRNRASVLKQLQRHTLSHQYEHPQLHTIRVREVMPTHRLAEQQYWNKYLLMNHSIKITLQITEVNVYMREWGNIENELSFQRFRMHLHHIDKQASSQYMRYHPHRGMYHLSGVVDNKVIKNNAQITLSVEQVIRSHNHLLYSDLFEKEQITLVAQRADGYVIAISQIDIAQINFQKTIQKMPICLKFVRKCQDIQQHTTTDPIFYAKCYLTLQCTPIPPQIDELNKNYQSQLKQTHNSRSPSPNRIISMGSKSIEKSPKKKRQLVSKLVSAEESIVSLSVYECWEYKYKLSHIDLSVSKELIYQSVLNIRERKVELVRISDQYYFKLFTVKEESRKPALISFSFNQKEYRVYVLTNTLFQTITLQDYKAKSKVQRKDSQLVYKNCLIDLGRGNLVYARQNHRIQKNIAKQQLESGLLATIFVRSLLRECQIHCNRPFSLVEIKKKEDGFMLTYRCLQEIIEEKDQLLVVYASSQHNKVNQIHVFDCQIQPRRVTRQSLYRQIYLPEGQMFTRMSLKMIANENSKYEIESADSQKVRVVNGSNFEYKRGSNECLQLQIVANVPLITDLFFRDSRSRSFFMRVSVKQEQKQTPQC